MNICYNHQNEDTLHFDDRVASYQLSSNVRTICRLFSTIFKSTFNAVPVYEYNTNFNISFIVVSANEVEFLMSQKVPVQTKFPHLF